MLRRNLSALLVAACLAACDASPAVVADAALADLDVLDAGPPPPSDAGTTAVDAHWFDAASADAALADAAVSCPVFGVASPLSFSLVNGAFPGTGHPDVVVHVPDGYDACRPQGAIVFFHGFNNCVANVVGATASACTPGGPARTPLHLIEQLDTVRVNAILIAVEARYDMASSDPGALAMDGGLRALLVELYDEHLSPLLGRATTVDDVERIVLASHSGGYVALARGLEVGGVDVDEIQLFDSLYGEIPVYQGWIDDNLARFDRAAVNPLRFVDVFTDGGGTATNSRALATSIEARLAASGDPANLLYDDTTATLDTVAFEHPLIVKHSMLSHDGVVLYYFERFLRASGFAELP